MSNLSYRSFSVARCFIVAVTVSIALAACSGPGAEREPSLEFIEVVTGDADPQTPLPLFIGIHGFGGAPESFSQFFVEHVTFPARFAFARGPVAQGTGFSWFPISWKTGADDFYFNFGVMWKWTNPDEASVRLSSTSLENVKQQKAGITHSKHKLHPGRGVKFRVGT